MKRHFQAIFETTDKILSIILQVLVDFEHNLTWRESFYLQLTITKHNNTTNTMTRSFSALAVFLLSVSTHAFAPPSLRSSPAATLVATTAGLSSSNTALGMFTGIVEEMGTVVDMVERNDMTLWDGSSGRGTELTVRGDVVMEGAYLGYVHGSKVKKYSMLDF